MSERETTTEEVEIVECPSCEKQAGIAKPRVGGVRAVCNDCETDMVVLSLIEQSEKTEKGVE